jgi:hypothetical protein
MQGKETLRFPFIGKGESRSAVAPLGDALPLGLALRRSQRARRHRALLAVSPFLALGRRRWSRVEGMAYGQGSSPAMPWPTPRWFGWPVHDAPPARTEELGPGLPGGAVSSGPSPPAAAGQAQRPEALATLVPALRWAGQRSGRPIAPALTWQPLSRLAPALSWAQRLARGSPATASHTRSNAPPGISVPWKPVPTASTSALANTEPRMQRSPAGVATLVGRASLPVGSLAERTDPGTAPAVEAPPGGTDARSPGAVHGLTPHSSAVAPPSGILKVLPELALGAAPVSLAAGGARHATPPRQPAHGAVLVAPRWAMPLGLAWPRVYQRGGIESRSQPSAPSPDEGGFPPPLPERKPHAGREPGPYASSPLQGLTVVADAIERLVEREVRAEVRRQGEAMQSQAPSQPDAASSPAAVDVASDEVARLLIQKIRALAQEERFRLGQLR